MNKYTDEELVTMSKVVEGDGSVMGNYAVRTLIKDLQDERRKKRHHMNRADAAETDGAEWMLKAAENSDAAALLAQVRLILDPEWAKDRVIAGVVGGLQMEQVRAIRELLGEL